MSGPRDFFAYHPRRWRLVLTVAALMSLVLTAWALASAVRSGAALEFARAGISGGLLLAMLFIHLRLRPRSQWGVKVTPLSLVVSRPTRGEIEIPWSAVKEVHRVGARRETLVVAVGEDRRVFISAHLFPSREEFEALASAIDERRPAQPHDA